MGGTWDLGSWSSGSLGCSPAGTIPGLSGPAVGGMCWRSSQDLEMSHQEVAAEAQVLPVATPGDAGMEHGAGCWAVSRALPSFQDEAPGNFIHNHDTVGFLPLAGYALLLLEGSLRPQRDPVPCPLTWLLKEASKGSAEGTFPTALCPYGNAQRDLAFMLRWSENKR